MSESKTIAERLFDSHYAGCELEEQLEKAGAKFTSIGWDWYDNSVELFGVPPDYRLPVEVQKVIYEAGFWTAFVNHTDKWETHYGFDIKTKFKESKGWRVSYPHKRNANDDGAIWVEERVDGWPKEWFENGKCVVKPKGGENESTS